MGFTEPPNPQEIPIPSVGGVWIFSGLAKYDYFSFSISFPISLEWGGKTVSETVYWFQYERDPSLNSNVYDVATKLVQKHFPGEFGSERLVQKIVDIILRQTAKREGENKGLLQCDVW